MQVVLDIVSNLVASHQALLGRTCKKCSGERTRSEVLMSGVGGRSMTIGLAGYSNRNMDLTRNNVGQSAYLEIPVADAGGPQGAAATLQ